MSWNISNDNTTLLTDIKGFEGTLAYQQKLGYFKNNKFWTYKDSMGYPTIGYGHLITENESFKQGLSESQADMLLAVDLDSKINDAQDIYNQYNMDLPDEAQLVLTEMVFQMGKSKVLQFKGTLTSLSQNDYAAAANGIRNSLWYKQTTTRAEILAKRLESC